MTGGGTNPENEGILQHHLALYNTDSQATVAGKMWSYTCRGCGLLYNPAFENTPSADQDHVGVIVQSADMTLQQMQMTQTMSYVQLKFTRLHGNKSNYDTFPSIYVKVTKSKFSMKLCVTSDHTDWTPTQF